MAETNNAINLLVQLGVDTTPSEENLRTQINKLAKKLKADVEINFNGESVDKTNRSLKVTGSDLAKISKAAKDTTAGISEIAEKLKGLGQNSDKPTEKIKKNFNDIKKTLEGVFKDFDDGSKKAIMKGIVDPDELKKQFAGMEAEWRAVTDTITNEAGKQAEVVKSLEVTYTDRMSKIRKTMSFNNRSKIVMPDGDEKNLWLPDTEGIRSLDSTMKQVEVNIQSAQKRLTDLRTTAKLNTDQFNELSNVALKMTDPNSINIFNQRLGETLEKNKQLSKEKKEQIALEERIRKLQNSIVVAQAKDPKGLGNNVELTNMLNSLKGIDTTSDGAAKSVKNVSDNFELMKSKATEASRSSMTVMESFSIAMEKFPVWMAASTVFFGTVRGIKSAISTIVDMDSQLVVMKRVAGSGIDIEKTLQKSVELSGELGNKIAEVNEGFIAFARQGFRGEDLEKMAEYATLLSNISEMSIEESSSIITAAIKGFNLEISDTAKIVDSLNEVDNNYAITSKILAEALQRSAGAANTYGVSMEKSIGRMCC